MTKDTVVDLHEAREIGDGNLAQTISWLEKAHPEMVVDGKLVNASATVGEFMEMAKDAPRDYQQACYRLIHRLGQEEQTPGMIHFEMHPDGVVVLSAGEKWREVVALEPGRSFWGVDVKIRESAEDALSAFAGQENIAEIASRLNETFPDGWGIPPLSGHWYGFVVFSPRGWIESDSVKTGNESTGPYRDRVYKIPT